MRKILTTEKKKETCNAAALGMHNAKVALEQADEINDKNSKPSIDWTDSQIESLVKSDFKKRNELRITGQKWKFIGIETVYGVRYVNYQSPTQKKVSMAWSKMVK